jgi:hypothetical protein
MKAAWMKGVPFFLALIAQILFMVGQPAAQEDYPVPQGNPSTWGIPGHPEKLPGEPQSTLPNMFSTPPAPGNEALGQPSAPAGEAEENYTGTRGEFGGIAGTGVDQSGNAQENR